MVKTKMVRFAALLSVGLLGACASAGPVVVQPTLGGNAVAVNPNRPLPPPLPVNPADVEFMSGMIHHHAQAIVMAGWAPTHGAGQAVRALCERIVVAQQDEIAIMSRWLKDNGQPVPEPNPKGMRMEMAGATHEMLMPGMLTEAQMAELDRARGRDFDRLFLTYMIQHHEGALQMVEKLLASHGAAIDETIYKMSSDVFADQSTEIDRMQKLLQAMGERP
jgi:uncharacterized protein (DUF305 family)